MLDNNKIAVVIPAYKVGAWIEQQIAAMPAVVDRVFVVDDASPDDVARRVEALADSRTLLIRHARNQGVGGATVTGIQAAIEAGFDIVVKCDGDGQMDPRDIPKLVQPVLCGEAEHAKGSRFRHIRALRSMPTWRFVGNVGLTFLTKLASGYWNVLDPVNGFFATRADVLKQIPLSRLSRRYFFETDLLIRLNIVEARVADVPFPARYGDEQSSLSVPRVLVDFPFRLLAGLVRRVFWRYIFYDVSPVAIFGLLGALLCGFGLSFGCYQWFEHAVRGVETPGGTVMIAALPFILGFQLLLQAIVLDIQNTPRPGAPSSRDITPR
ncbi:MAG: glycosyltransferase [Acidobacteria bacterium]|nr:glycosyltransferase [Acidobacteriota bacterium]